MGHSPVFQDYISSYSCAYVLQPVFITVKEKGTNLNAVRYSTSPIGGSKPPVQAIFMLYPSPGPLPTWKIGIKCQKEWRGGKKRRKRGGRNSQMCFRNKHQTTCQISPALFDKDCSGLCTCSPLVPCSQWTIW